jgi:chromosome segregation ATPase
MNRQINRRTRSEFGWAVFVASLLMTQIGAFAYDAAEPYIKQGVEEERRADLEHTRDSLLRQQDELTRSYQDTLTEIDRRNKELAQLNSQALGLQQALQHNQQALRSVEGSLHN